MHSKLIRLQTALLTLALLFTVLIPVSAYAEGETAAAQATADGSTTISDPNTLNAWERTQAYNNATTGRIWADKTVEEDEITFSGELKDQPAIKVSNIKDADFLVALSALSSYASTTTTNTQALDIVMVLDASGSMKDPMSKSDRTKRMDALKTAVNTFIDSAAAQNAKITDKEKEIQLSIVKFAGEYRKAVGNDTNLLGDNYSQIVKDLTVCNAANAPDLKKEVNKIKPGGATRADYGLQHAQTVLNNARPNAKKVVIFFTDGSPNNGGGFDNSIASKAIETAKSLKAAGAEVYTVGIFDDADPKADVSGASKENKFMQAVSSNYPSATYTKTGIIKYTWDFGDRPNKANYYMAASSADELKNVFADIFTSVSTTPAGPTQVTDKPQKEGYVTFDDPLGDYMEVKSFEAVAFSDKVFTKPSIKSSGDVDTYTFTGKHDNTVSGAYPNTADLSHIIITVTHGSGSDGDHVKVQIPASMLPLRYYKATNTDGTPKLEVNNAQPISVIYSVGLKEGVRDQIASGSFTDATLAAYVADNAENGKISFYSNKFDPNKKAADGQTTIGSTTATFTPAKSNNFYYHTKDTLLYTKSGEGADAKYTEATAVEPGKIYYYKLNYLHLTDSNHTITEDKTDCVPISIADSNEITKCIKEEDGKWYIKANTKKGSLPSAIDNQLGDKKEEDGTNGNRTGTADRRIDFQWNLDTDEGVLYLGNNGKLTMNATGSLKVTKKVEAAAGLTPNRNTDFTMQFTLTGDNVATNATYNYTVTGTEGTKPIKSGDKFTLKDGQTAEIVGLPAGSTYTITEENLPAGYAKTSITADGTGEVKAGTAEEVMVTNTYKPAPITVDPTDPNSNYPFKGEKILTGRNWKESDHFEFKLQAVTDDAPLPAEAGDKRYAECVVTGKTGDDGTAADFNFGSVTFDKPGTYEYNITENIPTEGKIAGVSYDSSCYRVTVTITDDGSGKLKGETKYYKSNDEGTTFAENPEDNNVAKFTNTYHADDVTVTLTATKLLNVVVGNRTLQPDEFSFTLCEKQADGTVSANPTVTAKNNANGKVTFNLPAFTSADVGKKTYVISEVNNHLGGIGYDTREYEVTFNVEDKGEGKLVASNPAYTLNDEPVDGAQFVNTYTATAGDTVKFTLKATKVLTGRALKEDEFHFIVTDKNGKEVSTGTNKADGTVTFSPIGFNQAQTTYAALLADLPTEQPTEDEKPVVDEQPTATEQPTEGNQPDVHRQPALLALTPVDNNSEEIAPTEEMQALLTHWYTISEVNEAKDGITYDPTVYTVCVKLRDKEGNGKLDIESVTYYEANKTTPLGDGVTPTFRNSYAAADSDAVTITLQKNLTGRALNAGEFTFKLSCPEDAAHNGLTATNDASGKVTFALTYKDPDSNNSDAAPTAYTYTVSEVKGDAEGVSYDDQTYTFTVEVQDDGTGKMKAALTEVPASMTFTNTYTPKATPAPTPTVTPSQEPSAAPAPTATPAPTAAPKPVATATPAPMTHIPQTSDTFPLALLIAILAISGGAVALLIVGKKRKK